MAGTDAVGSGGVEALPGGDYVVMSSASGGGIGAATECRAREFSFGLRSPAARRPGGGRQVPRIFAIVST